MNVQLVDSHCHLDMLTLDPATGLLPYLQQAEACGVQHFLSINVDPLQIEKLRSLIAPFAQVSMSLGLHPLHEPEQPLDQAALLRLAAADDVVALGETGLDFHYAPHSRSLQEDYFQMHLEAALQLNKPVIVHTREAADATLALLKPYTDQGGQGVIHCFTEQLDFARRVLDMGFHISLSGILTFRNADSLREVARYVPLDRLLLETDSPYLAPVPHRGQQNQPAFVREVAECLATLKGISLEQLAEQTTRNFFDLFALARPASS